MRYSFPRFAAALGVMLGAAVAAAQSGNGSDVTGPPGITIAGGAFTPLPVGNTTSRSGVGGASSSAARGAAGNSAVSAVGATFSSGAAVTSPATGQTIAPAAVQTVGALITTGSPASVASVGASLQSSGATAPSVGALMQAMAALANVSPSSAAAAIITAAKAFNALIAGASPGFFTSDHGGPPADFLAIQAALKPMVAAIGR